MSKARIILLLALAGSAGAADRSPELIEREAVRLVQVDVSVSGPPELLRTLTPDDFKVKVGLRRIRSFRFDNLCAETRAGEDATGAAPRPATFIFYFDQPLLTGAGRARSLQTVRGLIPGLIREGNRGMLVSNASALRTYTDFTDDPNELLAAVDRMQDDRSQWESYSTEESLRIDEIVSMLDDGEPLPLVLAKARIHQSEERWRMERSLRRLESVLPRLSNTDPPKAVLYFADTLRSNGGEHYLSFFGPLAARESQIGQKMQADSTTAPLAFDRVVDLAVAEGIRFYAVQGDDLLAFSHRSNPSSGASARAGRGGYSSRVRINDARQTLESLAAETGGYAFLRGISSERIASRIHADFACLCLISFPPEPGMVDKAYRVVVESLRPGVTARSRGRLVVQSESSRRVARLLGAFIAPGVGEARGLEVRGALVPLAFERGRYVALAQVSLPGVPLIGTTWDLGLTLHDDDTVLAEASGRVSVTAPSVPLVLEREVRFPPGRLELVSVAHETTGNLIASSRRSVDWPDPRGRDASVGPIVLLQSLSGVFLRDRRVRDGGPLCLGVDEPVRTDLPIALVALVCRGRGDAAGLRMERALAGGKTVDFPPIELDDSESRRCVQIRDVVPAGTLQAGDYRYEVRIMRGSRALAEGGRRLTAVPPGA